ncbi:MAG: hypothetical protein J3R72DRAFT_444631 [Linnemannia gamsii]|nr:MAG: hypothetical protein J3R72DRAFT_444631 [Linnemannia gamsii]
MEVRITAPDIYWSPDPSLMTIYRLRREQSSPLRSLTTWESILVFFGTMIGFTIIAAIIYSRRINARDTREGNNNNSNRDALNARGRRITQEFAMGTLTHRTGHASGVDGRSRRTRIGAVATPTRLHPSITNADIVAYENAVLSNAESSSDPPPVFVSSPDEESGEFHPTTATAADPLPPPTYEDDGQVPEYSRDPQQPEVVIPISIA